MLFRSTLSCAALASAVVISSSAIAATGEPAPPPPVDPMPCFVATAANDDDRIIAACGALIDNERTLRPDRLKALIARGSVYARKDQADRAIADYDDALRLDPTQAGIFNARGELWRAKGDRPRALRDFGMAMKLDPQNELARSNHKTLALEVERLGAQLPLRPKVPLK